MSSAEILPFLPVPVTLLKSTPISLAKRRTEGVAGTETISSGEKPVSSKETDSKSDGVPFTPLGCSFTKGLGWVSLAIWVSLVSMTGASTPSPSREKITCPTATSSPSLIWILLTIPTTFEGTSIAALSVSSSRTGWSLSTLSPGRMKIFTIFPESIFSPSTGSLNSIAMVYRKP